jgi:hypothetical protein
MLPVSKIRMPACLAGARNGQLTSSLLVECGIGSFKMVPPAARAMKALVAAAESELGIDVWATGTYRSLEQQVSLFMQRYTRVYQAGRRHEVWQGEDYWLKPRVAGAANPGTSNHGLGLAIDFAEKRNGKVVSVSSRFVRWLCEHAIEFGFSAEDQSESWHWRYVAGDTVPAGVAAFEGTNVIARPARTPAPKPTAPVLRRGSKGQAVQHLQVLLQSRGFYLGQNCDGQFGPKTDAAVKAFQRSAGLKTDGVVGPLTWKALFP